MPAKMLLVPRTIIQAAKAVTKRGPYNIFSPELTDDLKVPEYWNCAACILQNKRRQNNFACEVANF